DKAWRVPAERRVVGLDVPGVEIEAEGSLAVDQVVEPPDRDAALAEQFPRIPFHAGMMDQALAVGQLGRNRNAGPEPAPFEREEPERCGTVAEDSYPGGGPGTARRYHELRSQERVPRRRGAALHGMPRRDVGAPEFIRALDGNAHSRSPFPRAGKLCCRPSGSITLS